MTFQLNIFHLLGISHFLWSRVDSEINWTFLMNTYPTKDYIFGSCVQKISYYSIKITKKFQLLNPDIIWNHILRFFLSLVTFIRIIDLVFFFNPIFSWIIRFHAFRHHWFIIIWLSFVVLSSLDCVFTGANQKFRRNCVIVHTIEINFFPLVSWTVHHHHTRLNKNKQFICAMQICFFTFCNCEWQSMLHSSSKGIETGGSLKMTECEWMARASDGERWE